MIPDSVTIQYVDREAVSFTQKSIAGEIQISLIIGRRIAVRRAGRPINGRSKIDGDREALDSAKKVAAVTLLRK
jgi:hypothetical protein